MSIKVLDPPLTGNSITFTIESMMPRVLMSVDKTGVRVYKDRQKRAAYLIKRDGRFKTCVQLAATHCKAIRRTEKQKALVLFNKRNSSTKVKTLDEVFGVPEVCVMFDLSDIRNEVQRLAEEKSKEEG